MSVEYRIADDEAELAVCAAGLVTALSRTAVRERGVFRLALSGGKTPQRLFEILAQPQFTLPWQNTALFWSDERFVPDWHADSNYRLVRETLLRKLAVQPALVCPVDTELPTAEAAAKAYATAISGAFSGSAVANGWPVFDCILLGIGMDGHTASLFPGDPAVHENNCWTTVGRAPDHSQRISLTLPVLNAARQVIFLVSGAEKAAVVAAVASGEKTLPAAMVAAEKITWLLDAPAAAQLK